MPKTDALLTTTTPMLLVVAAAAMLGLRCVMVVNEIRNPTKPVHQIAWKTLVDTKTLEKLTKKPILYFFTSPGSGPCRQIETNALTNRRIVEMVNQDFYPVRVEDNNGMSGQRKSEQIELLEDKYFVTHFPEFIVAAPSGEKIMSSDLFMLKTQEVREFLAKSLRRFPLELASQYMDKCQFEQAAAYYREYLSNEKIKWAEAPWTVINYYLCLKLLNRELDADNLYRDARNRLTSKSDALMTLNYFNDKESYESLKNWYGETATGRFRYRTYAGLKAYFAGDTAVAMPLLEEAVSADMTYYDEFTVADYALKQLKADARGGKPELGRAQSDTVYGAQQAQKNGQKVANEPKAQMSPKRANEPRAQMSPKSANEP